jgi:hypothetical protein
MNQKLIAAAALALLCLSGCTPAEVEEWEQQRKLEEFRKQCVQHGGTFSIKGEKGFFGVGVQLECVGQTK